MGIVVRQADGMQPDFGGTTAQLYAKYRRDLPAAQAAELAERIGLGPDDVVVDLGCGTGQLAVPLQPYCAAVVGIDPEPAMLVEFRARRAARVLYVLGDDHDLPRLGSVFGRPVGAVVIGNALHWMDEAATFRAGAALVRLGGVVAVITQGPPMWLGAAPWQVAVRETLEASSGPANGNCRTDQVALDDRLARARALDLDVEVVSWEAEHVVDIGWVVGHLGSAMNVEQWSAVADQLTDILQTFDGQSMVEQVSTTALIARRTS